LSRVYKILSTAEWSSAKAAGAFEGSADDRRDGYIHLSAEAQWRETARRWFAGRYELVLVAFESEDLGEDLKWEPSRGGDLFPHLYGPLPTGPALEVFQLRVHALGDVEATP
jgi:uncharacterized protein (DUF952 family)